MENCIFLEIPNKQYKTKKGTIVSKPNIKLFSNLLHKKNYTNLNKVTKDNVYIFLAINKEDTNVIDNGDNTYSFFTSSIKYIVYNHTLKDSDKVENYHRLCLEVGISGKYIPIINTKGDVLFTNNDYNFIRSQMKGLSYYNMKDTFVLAPDEYLIPEPVIVNNNIYSVLEISKDIEQNISNTERANNMIVDSIKSAVDEMIIDTTITNNPNSGVAELLNIGSTGRGTNLPLDIDFDFMLRISEDDYHSTIQYLTSRILGAFGKKIYDYESVKIVNGSDLRLSDIYLPGFDNPVKVDISFAVKNTNISYSTEMCVMDRLKTIKDKYPDKYNFVLANIILAKTLLKESHVYKKKNSKEDPQGGIGGIGIENWVLQNKGSFLYASQSFLQAVDKSLHMNNVNLDTLKDIIDNNYQDILDTCINRKGYNVDEKYRKVLSVFHTFQELYPIYDYGENHNIAKQKSKSTYPHDDFIHNMHVIGFYKMIDVLTEYVVQLENQNTNQIQKVYKK